jgi:hypothetical protein
MTLAAISSLLIRALPFLGVNVETLSRGHARQRNQGANERDGCLSPHTGFHGEFLTG